MKWTCTIPPQNGANSPGAFYDARNGGEGEEEGQREARGSRDEIKVAVVGFQKTVEDYTYDVEVCLIPCLVWVGLVDCNI